jgi:Xaa-Pro dipeptidase
VTIAIRRFQIEQGSGPLTSELPFSSAEYDRRLEALRKEMAAKGIDIFVSFGPENIFYLTGHDTPAYQYTQACIIAMEGLPVNVLRGIDASNTFQNSWSRQAVAYRDDDDPVDAICSVINEMATAGAHIGLESDAFFITPRGYNALIGRLQSHGYRTLPGSLFDGLRIVKSQEEISCIRRAARITEAAMTSAIEASEQGISENEIAAATWRTLVGMGSQFPGLPPFISSGPRTSLAHSTWAGRVLCAGDPLNFEIPGVVNRYVAPLFRVGSVGAPSSELIKLWNACVASLEIIIGNLKPGVPASFIYELHVENFRRHGLAVGHRAGYSVGVNYAPDWGEGNILSIVGGESRPMQPGMVFHLVPGIFVPNVCGVTVSETVLVTESGCEPITTFPRDLFVV